MLTAVSIAALAFAGLCFLWLFFRTWKQPPVRTGEEPSEDTQIAVTIAAVLLVLIAAGTAT